MNLNKIFLKTEARKRIEKIIAKLLVNILFDFLLKDLKLGFFLKFHYILNIPLRCEGSLIITSSSINGLYNFFMLIIKSLNRSWDEIIRADTFLHVFTIVDVFFLDIFILLFIACWRKEKCEDCLCLLEFNWNVCLKIFSSEFLLIFFYCFGFFFKFILRLGFRFIRWHERFFLIHRATFLHLRVILRSQWAFRFDFILLFIFSLLLLFGLQKFQILLCVLFISLCDQFFWSTNFTIHYDYTVIDLWLRCLCPTHWRF